MFNQKPVIVTLFCCLIYCSCCFAQAPKFSNEYLSIGVGARGQAMAGSVTASSNDVTSGFWNPAGMASINSGLQVSAMHAEWFAGIGKYDYIAIGKPLSNKENRSVLGISLIRFGVDNIPNTFNLIDSDGSVNYDNVTPFSAADYAGMLTYAQRLPSKNLQIGGSFKVLHRKAGPFATAWGFGLDLGILYKLKRHWQFGLMAKDVSTSFNAWSFSFTEEEKNILNLTNNDVPTSSVEITKPKFSLGIAYQTTIRERLRVLFELDLDFNTDGQRNVLISTPSINIDPHAGLEIVYKEFIFLRGGIGNIQKIEDVIDPSITTTTFQPNAGIGIKLKGFRLDYAYTDIGNISQVLYSHVFSIVMDLKINKKEKVKTNSNPNRPKPPKIIIEQID